MASSNPKSHAQVAFSKYNDPLPLESPASVDFDLELAGATETNMIPDSYEGMIALDPDVLASLVVQLRNNLGTAQRDLYTAREEREDLITALAIAQTKISDHKFENEDLRKVMTDIKLVNEQERNRGDRLEKDLEESQRKIQDGEEAISMLRTKVEESRRGLMRLQSEQSRRMSQLNVASSPMPLLASPFATSFDSLPRTPVPGKRQTLPASGFGTPGPSLLLSAPPKGRLDRRQSSTSDNGDDGQYVTMPGEASVLSQKTSRRTSLYGRESLLNPLGAELEHLRHELVAVRVELEETKGRLNEEREAREASDICVKALKEFIAENSIGDGSSSQSFRGLMLPPLPSEATGDEDEPAPKAGLAKGAPAKKGWGIASLFSSNPATPAAEASNVRPPVTRSNTTGAVGTAGGNSFVGRWSRSSSISQDGPIPPEKDNYTPAPVRRKFGGLSNGGSISSVHSIQSNGSYRPTSIPLSSYPPSLAGDYSAPPSSGSGSGPDSPEARARDTVSIAEEEEPMSAFGTGFSLSNGQQVEQIIVVTSPEARKNGELTPTVVHAPSVFATAI